MKRTATIYPVIIVTALSAFGLSASTASGTDKPKHAHKITKAKAEQIALAKIPGGSVRSAELETAKGQRFWSVYIAKPGSKNAKEIRVSATNGKILSVQTERPEDQAEEPSKSH
jgi:uncharacterized membrane protein YkoI